MAKLSFREVEKGLEISRESWIKTFSALKSTKRLELLEYFNRQTEPVSYSTTRDDNGFSDGNLIFHLNILLSADLIVNRTEKTEFGRHPHSFYEIAELGKQVLETITP